MHCTYNRLTESASEDFLELYFENEKKSGGGDLKDIQLDETEGEAYVTFETEEGMLTVLFSWLYSENSGKIICLD